MLVGSLRCAPAPVTFNIERMKTDRLERLKRMLILAKEQGYLTYDKLIHYLPEDMRDPEQLEGIISMLSDMNFPIRNQSQESKGPGSNSKG